MVYFFCFGASIYLWVNGYIWTAVGFVASGLLLASLECGLLDSLGGSGRPVRSTKPLVVAAPKADSDWRYWWVVALAIGSVIASKAVGL